MKQYRLRWVMHQPSEDTEGMFMAEAPDLPGCRAWGETWTDAYEHLRSVAAEFLASYRTTATNSRRSTVVAPKSSW